jgi:glycosyltransferase involved in cell wall biosynthesis
VGLTVIILTKNEEIHLRRALASVEAIADRVFVIDSGSHDSTVAIARHSGAVVLTNTWVNHASQFNWALDHLPRDTDWVLRLDADEIVSEGLADEISVDLTCVPDQIKGIYISRRINFLSRPIRWGGVFPVRSVRLFRYGFGRCENRWMDEHIIVEGCIGEFMGEIIDDNLNSLTWWTEKHNGYSSREVIDLLNLEYGFRPHESIANLRGGQQAGVKRWIKERVYSRIPGGFRAVLYFAYRYFVRLGFLDGREGTAFHVLQGFWYRYLVDVKLHEVKCYMKRHGTDAPTAIRAVLGIEV